MAQFYTLLTQVGQAKLANAVALGNTIELTHLAVGDGGGSLPTPDSNRTALVNEVRRAPINLADIDPDNPNWIVVEQVLPPDVGGWTIREIGVFDAAGDLIAYGNYPETFKPTLDQGSGRTQTIRMVLQVSHTAAVTLKVDPAVVLATRQYADQKAAATAQAAAQALQEHEQGRAHPLATDTERGMVVKASQPLVDAGEDDEKFVSPKKLKDWATQWVKQATETVAGMVRLATAAQAQSFQSNEKVITPGTLGAAMNAHVPGMEQNWQDVLADRSVNTTYTNTTGRAIQIAITASSASSSGSGTLEFFIDSNLIARDSSSSHSWTTNIFAIVPPGSTYRLDFSPGGSRLLRNWVELR